MTSSSSYSVASSSRASVVSSSSSRYSTGGSSVVSAWTQQRRKRRRYRQKLSSFIRYISCSLFLFFMGNNIYFLTHQIKNMNQEESSSSWNTLLQQLSSPNNNLTTTSVRTKKTKTLLHTITSNHQDWHPATRRERFPSIQERVRRYMSIWYQPHACPFKTNNFKSEDFYLQGKTYYGGGIVELDTPLFLQSRTCSTFKSHNNMKVMIQSVSKTLGRKKKNDYDDDDADDDQLVLHSYCKAIQRDGAMLFARTDVPILVQFQRKDIGNHHHHHLDLNMIVDASNGVPLLAQWRTATNKLPPFVDDPTSCQVPFLRSGNNNKPLYPPIVWQFLDVSISSLERSILRADTEWNDKVDKAAAFGLLDADDDDEEEEPSILETSSRFCRHRYPSQPCTLVLHHGIWKRETDDNSTDTTTKTMLLDDYIDWRISNKNNKNQSLSSSSETTTTSTAHQISSHRIPTIIPQLRNWLRHKIVVSLDQKDDDLLWKLASSSVLLMPIPTRTSWIMEELLVPWVHYVPLNITTTTSSSSSPTTLEKKKRSNSNETTTTTNQLHHHYQKQQTSIRHQYYNIMEMVQWIRTHDDEARKIAERATLFVYDLWYHPDATRDNEEIKKEILRRYSKYWQTSNNY